MIWEEEKWKKFVGDRRHYILNIDGFDVLIMKKGIEFKMSKGKKILVKEFYNAYVELKGSSIAGDSFLNATFRDGDIIGFDTGHAWNEAQTIDEKLMTAINQVQFAIELWKKVIA